MSDSKHKNATRRGFATPEIDLNATTGQITPVKEPAPAKAAGAQVEATETVHVAAGPSAIDLHANTPVVEIEVIHQHGPAPNTDRPFQTLEVWTQNTIYVMDPTMQCVAVRERASHNAVPKHPFVGRRLVGGQTRRGETIQLSYPYPRPGTEAVFEDPRERQRGFAQTSTVTRVVLRLHMITVTPSALTPTWAEITRNTGGMPAVKL